MQGILYLVATPIGNLADITLRAKDILVNVDVIACEDTRHTLGLLNHLGIRRPLISYHKHNEKAVAVKIISLLAEGKSVALVSDAGMPCISDPGAYLVTQAREAGIDIKVIPGASAVISGAALSGAVESGFVFLGFLQGTKTKKRERLAEYASEQLPLIVYSAPHDIKEELQLAYEVFGKRQVWVIKEMTKIYEGVIVGLLGEVELQNEKGEFVLVMQGAEGRKEYSADMIAGELDILLDMGISKRDATAIVARYLGISKKRVYDIGLAIDKQ